MNALTVIATLVVFVACYHKLKDQKGHPKLKLFSAAIPAALVFALLRWATGSEPKPAPGAKELAELEAREKEREKTRPPAATAPPEPQRKWYQGGTLHKATGAEWNAAAYENKLATSADLLARLWDEGQLKPSLVAKLQSIDDLKEPAGQLVVGLDKVYESPAAKGSDVPTNTAMLLFAMGWLKK